MARDLAARLHVASGWLFVALWGLVVADLALHADAVRRAAEVALAILILLAMLKASPHIRALGGVLLTGTGLLAWSGGDWRLVERGLHAALAIGAFLPVVALVRTTVHASPAVPAIRERVGAMPDDERRAWMTGGAFLLGSILSLGYVSVQRPMLPAELDPRARLSLAGCGTRGLGLAVAWSPFFAASAVAGQLVPAVAAWRTLALGMLLAAVGAVIAHLMFNRSLGLRGLARALARVWPIVPPTVGLAGAVVGTSTATGWNVLQSVIVVVPVVCAGYLVAFARPQARRALPAVAAGAGRMGDEVLILAASTVFGAAVAAQGIPPGVEAVLREVGAQPWLVIAGSVAVIASLGIAGLHPMVSASVIVPTCLALKLPIAEVVLAQVVVLAWSLSAVVSAWTLPVVMTAGAFAVPVRRLVFGENLRFIAVYGLAAVAVLAGVNRLLLG